MVVIRNGCLVVDRTYPHDCSEISPRVRGPLGCDTDTCDDAAAVYACNCHNPDHHPFYTGRDVHSLQSVTKSVAATVIGVAITRGDIPGSGSATAAAAT